MTGAGSGTAGAGTTGVHTAGLDTAGLDTAGLDVVELHVFDRAGVFSHKEHPEVSSSDTTVGGIPGSGLEYPIIRPILNKRSGNSNSPQAT